MASFTSGGSTLKSTTLENALIEGLMILRNAELNATNNPANENRVSFSIDQSLTLTGNANFPATESVNITNGTINWSVNSYLSGLTFAAGTGTIKSTNLPAAIIEVAKLIQNLEAQLSKNQSGLNRINLTYDSDAATVSLSFESQLTLSISTTGLIQLQASTYLID